MHLDLAINIFLCICLTYFLVFLSSFYSGPHKWSISYFWSGNSSIDPQCFFWIQSPLPPNDCSCSVQEQDWPFFCANTWAVQESLDWIVILRYLIWSMNSSSYPYITIVGGLTLYFLDLSIIIKLGFIWIKYQIFFHFPQFIILFSANWIFSEFILMSMTEAMIIISSAYSAALTGPEWNSLCKDIHH